MPCVDLEAHGPAEAAPAQLHLDRGEQVVGLLLLEGEVGVAGDPEGVVAPRRSMPGNSWSRWAAMTCSSGTKRSPSGMTTKRGSSGGTFTRAKRRSPVVGVAHDDRQVERQVRDVRERVARVDGQRGEHREDPLLEHLDEVLPVVVVELVPRARTGCRPRPRAGTISSRKIALLPVGELERPAPAARGAARPAVRPSGRAGADAGRDLVLQAGDPHLEELVEVLAEDGQELGPLEQRRRAGPRPGPGRGALKSSQDSSRFRYAARPAGRRPSAVRRPRPPRRSYRGSPDAHMAVR